MRVHYMGYILLGWIGPCKQENKLKGLELLWNLERLDFLLNKLLVVSNPPCSQ